VAKALEDSNRRKSAYDNLVTEVPNMKIIDLTEQHEKLYCVCLEDWSDDREAILKHGIYDGIFVDGKNVQSDPPPSCGKIKKLIAKRARRL
jgi:hypothetical protein